MKIKNVMKLDGSRTTLTLPTAESGEIDGSHLTMLPALVDPHVHFRTPGNSHKEDWKTASFAALFGGVTTVCDMPNNTPSITTIERLREKKKIIDATLRSIGSPLRYGLYLGAEKENLKEISKAKGEACGIKVFMGGSTGDLLLDSDVDLAEVFQRAHDADLLVALHAEDETLLQKRMKEFAGITDVSIHSTIRNERVAQIAVEKAINYSLKYGTTIYLLHLSTKEELELVRKGKKAGAKIYAETTPHHLFLNSDDYQRYGTLIQMNPPIRDKRHHDVLWEALRDGTLDTIGTDHAPHTLAEKGLPYGKAPSGIPGIDTLLPLLLHAVNEKKLTLNRLVELTRTNPMKMLGLEPNDDFVLVDMNLRKKVTKEDLKTKCGWSPYENWELQGWPLHTISGGQLFSRKKFEGKQQSEVKDFPKSNEPMRRAHATH